MRHEVALARDPDSAAEARRALGAVSDHLSQRRLEDAQLLVSELVTNAIRHAGLEEAQTIRLIVEGASVPVLVDAAHVPGALPGLEVEALGVDFWVGNLHKWAYAPRGTAQCPAR